MVEAGEALARRGHPPARQVAAVSEEAEDGVELAGERRVAEVLGERRAHQPVGVVAARSGGRG